MIQLLGIPYDLNSSFLRGPSYAPPRIRLADKEGSANQFTEDVLEIKEGVIYHDTGDLMFEDPAPKAVFQTIKSNIASLIKNGDQVLSLGGDHSVSDPIISAFAEQYSGLHILHLDAHADLYEDFEGNPYSHASPFARIMEEGKVSGLTQVGIRTFNSHQKEQAERYGVNIVEAKDFNLDFIVGLQGPLYISLDLDVLDPAFAPGVSHHEPGGLSNRDILDIIQKVNVPIVGADIVEYNPMRDINHMTAMVAYKMMKELMGKMFTSTGSG
ncbi:MAG: agmatinase [Cytophagales bacterium]|nr:agmatinase [Cytophagales bacterium]